MSVAVASGSSRRRREEGQAAPEILTSAGRPGDTNGVAVVTCLAIRSDRRCAAEGSTSMLAAARAVGGLEPSRGPDVGRSLAHRSSRCLVRSAPLPPCIDASSRRCQPWWRSRNRTWSHLRACVALAREAFEAGDGPFGTVLVDADGTVLWSGRNHDGRRRRDPAPRARGGPVVGAARARGARRLHGLHLRGALPDVLGRPRVDGAGRIVYAVSSEQLLAWRARRGAPPSWS